MLLVAMLALGTATFAWFTQNTTATADGLYAKTIKASTLKISKTDKAWTTHVAYGFGTAETQHIMDPASHAADGNWYGIARKEIRTYVGMSYGSERYDRTGFEWFMDKISDGRCTTQKIVLPSNTTDVYNIGMSGKWLMFAIGNTVYRLDTTNVANVEVVPNVAYNNAQQFTFCVDDDVVINGWYFHNGEPKLYVRN